MATPSLANDSSFELRDCRNCARPVLGYFDLDESGDELIRCLHCDLVLTGATHLVDRDDLLDAGYTVVEARTCGNGGGCSSGGCGSR